MKNSDLWEQYKEYTQTLSDNARKLAFAAGAICWFFRYQNGTFPPQIYVALILVVAFFMVDILQYAYASVALHTWTRREEKRKYKETGSIEGDYEKPASLDYPTATMLWIKTVLLFVAFFLIGARVLG